MNARISNSLRAERSARGFSQKKMARLAGVSRQSYAAIESGASVPSTDVALRLARALGTGVEQLFGLPEDPHTTLQVELSGPRPNHSCPVRVVEIGGKSLGFPLQGMRAPRLEPADGIGHVLPNGTMRVELFHERPPTCDLTVSGCDPSFELVARFLRRESAVESTWVRCGSRAALEALAAGRAHVAGVHLPDAETGLYNESWITKLVPFPCTRIRFARWEQCLILGEGNPLGVSGVQDLARDDLRFVNRESGSGSRTLMDMRLAAEGVSQDAIPGYRDTHAAGHVEVAHAIASGLADAGVGIRAAALSFDLALVPLTEETYDLVIPNHFLELRAVQVLLTTLPGRSLKAQIEALGGYDTEGMGQPQ